MKVFENIIILIKFILVIGLVSPILFIFGFSDFAYALMFCGTVIIRMSLFFL